MNPVIYKWWFWVLVVIALIIGLAIGSITTPPWS
jgi:hypothetical protein